MSKLQQLARDLGELCESKRRAYGDSVGKSAEVLRLLYPSGLAPHQYLDAITTARIIDKLSRKAQGADPHGESPYIDVAGHALVALAHSVEVHDSCASANGSAAERQSQEPNDSAARSAAAPTTPIANDASAKSSPKPSSKPSSSAFASMAAPAPTATANASAVADALQKGVERNREDRCAQCVGPLPDFRLCFKTMLLRPGNPETRTQFLHCSLSCAVVFEGRITKK